MCSFLHDKDAFKEYQKNNPVAPRESNRRNDGGANTKGGSKAVIEPRSTLIEKLLSSQVNEDDNKILQCLRFLSLSFATYETLERSEA